MRNYNWIPVNKTLPIIPEEYMDNGFTRMAVLVTDTKYDMTMIGWYDIEDCKFYKDYDILADIFKNVIAWMPLPKVYNK
jgi:hypothetical protein